MISSSTALKIIRKMLTKTVRLRCRTIAHYNFYPDVPTSMVPAGVHRQVFGVVCIFFILLKVELGQQLAGFGHRVVHSTIE